MNFLYALIALFTSGSSSSIIKKGFEGNSRYKGIFYMYLVTSILLLTTAFATGMDFSLPQTLILPFIIQIIIGAVAIMAYFKGLARTKAAITPAFTKLYAFFVLIGGIIFFNEQLTTLQIIGSLLIIIGAIVIAFKKIEKLRIEPGMFFLFIAVITRAFFYIYIKIFVSTLGALKAAVFTELGVALLVMIYYLYKGVDLSFPKMNQKYVLSSGFLDFIIGITYNFSVAAIGVSLTAVIVSANPIVAIIASHVILKERLPLVKYLAIIGIVLGLILIVL